MKHMINITKAVAVGALLATTALSAVPSAKAADMLYDPQAAYTPVEFGTGWYIRGHVGATWHNAVRDVETSAPVPGTNNQNIETTDEKSVWSAGVGAGYRFSKNFRADVGWEFLGDSIQNSRSTTTNFRPPCSNAFRQEVQTDALGNQILVIVPGHTITNCQESTESSFHLQSFMGNAYYDFDTRWAGLSPFVGVGLGAVRNRYTSSFGNITCTAADFEQCNPTDGGEVTLGENYTQEGNRNNGVAYHGAFALTAGLSYALSDNLFLDTSYRYTKMIENPLWDGENGLSLADVPTDFHAIRFGLRYEIF